MYGRAAVPQIKSIPLSDTAIARLSMNWGGHQRSISFTSFWPIFIAEEAILLDFERLKRKTIAEDLFFFCALCVTVPIT